MISWFTVATPISVALGGPISTALLGLDGTFGLAGWRWVFLAEAVPAVILGFLLLAFLRDRPAHTSWLTQEEKDWIDAELTHEKREIESVRTYTLFQSLTNIRVVALAVIYFGIVTASVGLVIFVPQIIKQLGVSNLETGFLTMIPYAIGTVSMVAWGYFSDRMQERKWNLFIGCLAGGAGLVIAGLLGGSFWSLAAMCLATIGFYGSKGPFWPLPSMFLTGTAAAAGMALINSVGNVGGFMGPFLVGWIKDATGSFENGLYALAGFMLLAALVTAIGVQAPRRRVAGSGLAPSPRNKPQSGMHPTSRCFRCFGRKLSASGIPILAEILGRQGIDARKNSEIAAVLSLFLAVLREIVRTSFPPGKVSDAHYRNIITRIAFCQFDKYVVSKAGRRGERRCALRSR